MEVLEELNAIGVEVIPQGENLVVRPASKVPAELKERLRAHKAEVLAVLKARAAPRFKSAHVEPAPAKPCYACGGRLFWRSVDGAVMCYRCHPAAPERLVTDLIWGGEIKARIQ